ncbi:MAG: hypothetical protein KatS3mg050_1942 [Litorilinea sp.]|nr:MAG: hypothetical protein KatS3mg050_1942 [Litorilinea sp.]
MNAIPRGLWLAFSLLLLLLAACQPIPAPGAEAVTPAATATAVVSPAPQEPTPTSQEAPMPTSAPVSNPLVQQAMADLAQRLSIPTEEITLVSYEEVVWPDASMGCPQPGMAYIQVPQDGARIVLQAGGQTYVYHSGGNRPPFLCTQPPAGSAKEAPGGNLGTPNQ